MKWGLYMPYDESLDAIPRRVFGDMAVRSLYRSVVLRGPEFAGNLTLQAFFGLFRRKLQYALTTSAAPLQTFFTDMPTLRMSAEQVAAQPFQAFVWPQCSASEQLAVDLAVYRRAREGVRDLQLPIAFIAYFAHEDKGEQSVQFFYPPTAPGELLLDLMRRISATGE